MKRSLSVSAVRAVLAAVLTTVVSGSAANHCLADAFDDHTAYWLRQGVRDRQPLTELTLKDGLKLSPIGRRIEAPCIVLRTGEDNWAKALLSWGFRKGPGPDAPRVPIVVIERFVTYRGDRQNLTTANGGNVMLFAGFGFDFDIGQVVPEGQGADLLCGPDGTLTPGGGAQLFGLDGPATPEPEPGSVPNPESHDGVLPTDFAGAWHVRIDGRWEGRWELTVDGRQIFGRFISDETKSIYEITGKIAALPHNAKLNIELANAAQSIDAFLWTKDKSAMAGVVTLADRRIGFFATRIRPDADGPGDRDGDEKTPGGSTAAGAGPSGDDSSSGDDSPRASLSRP